MKYLINWVSMIMLINLKKKKCKCVAKILLVDAENGFRDKEIEKGRQ